MYNIFVISWIVSLYYLPLSGYVIIFKTTSIPYLLTLFKNTPIIFLYLNINRYYNLVKKKINESAVKFIFGIDFTKTFSDPQSHQLWRLLLLLQGMRGR